MTSEGKCKICAQGIQGNAKKCTHCGEFQSYWRRALQVSQSTITLALAIVAFAGVFLGDVRPWKKAISDWLHGEKWRIASAPISLNSAAIQVVVKNLMHYPVAVSRVSCVLYIPIDERKNSISYLKEYDSGSPEKYHPKLYRNEVVGQFLISYKLDPVVLLGPYEDKFIKGQQVIVSAPLGQGKIGEGEEAEEVVSFCMVDGRSTQDDNAVGAFILSPFDLTDFDLRRMIEIGEFKGQNESKRDELLYQLDSVRKK